MDFTIGILVNIQYTIDSTEQNIIVECYKVHIFVETDKLHSILLSTFEFYHWAEVDTKQEVAVNFHVFPINVVCLISYFLEEFVFN